MVSVDGSIENKRSRGWFQLTGASRIKEEQRMVSVDGSIENKRSRG
jgi:hypothetical protein